MGFEGPAAPLLPAWLASTLPAAFPWDRKEAECYLGHSPSSTKFQHLCLKRALPITLFTTTKFEQVKFTHFKHTATGNCTWAFFFFLSGESVCLSPSPWLENLKYLLLTHKCYIFKCVFTANVSVKNSTVGTRDTNSCFLYHPAGHRLQQSC